MTDSTTPPAASAAPVGTGLRQRKRAATMRRIRLAAVDAFEARGFDRVTIDEIAAAAEVSPSSIYRAFGTKEGLVLRDEADDDWTARLADALAPPAPRTPSEGLRAALATLDLGETMPDATRRIRIAIATPSVRAAAALEIGAIADRVAAELAVRGAGDPATARLVVLALVTMATSAVEAAFRAGDPGRPEAGGNTSPDAFALASVLDRVVEVAAPLLDANADAFRPTGGAR